MIRHVVMFQFAPEAEGAAAAENALKAKELLLALQEKILTIRRSEVGINHAEAAPGNYTVCLIADFDSIEDLNAYIVHPEHVKVGEFMKKVRLNRSCVDFEISAGLEHIDGSQK